MGFPVCQAADLQAAVCHLVALIGHLADLHLAEHHQVAALALVGLSVAQVQQVPALELDPTSAPRTHQDI